jgi:molybdopterin converting factor small subunit
MPQVILKVSRWLSQGSEGASTDFVEIPVTTSEGESITGVVNRLAAENRDIPKAIFDEGTRAIQANVLVMVNGRIVNPHQRPEIALNEGDEVTFLPMHDGG